MGTVTVRGSGRWALLEVSKALHDSMTKKLPDLGRAVFDAVSERLPSHITKALEPIRSEVEERFKMNWVCCFTRN